MQAPETRERGARPAPRPEVAVEGHHHREDTSQVITCGWFECGACATVLRFSERVAAGEIPVVAPITSPWWESEEAERLYARGAKLPPCQHPEGVPAW